LPPTGDNNRAQDTQAESVFIGFRAPVDFRERTVELARSRQRTLSGEIRLALEEHLERAERELRDAA
jgi:hypothetical protein